MQLPPTPAWAGRGGRGLGPARWGVLELAAKPTAPLRWVEGPGFTSPLSLGDFGDLSHWGQHSPERGQSSPAGPPSSPSEREFTERLNGASCDRALSCVWSGTRARRQRGHRVSRDRRQEPSLPFPAFTTQVYALRAVLPVLLANSFP